MEDRVAAYFSGKRVLITGGASGIGAELASQMLEAGATVRVADWSEARIEQAKMRFDAFAPRVGFERVDVSKQEQANALVRRMSADCDGFDMLVNNAGIFDKEPVESIAIERFRQVMDVNFWGVVYGCYAALPIFLSQGYGHIVNMASLGGILHAPFQAAYGTSKAAVLAFSDTLRYEMELRDIAVSTVCPGDVQSGLFNNSVEAMHSEVNRNLAGSVHTGASGAENADLFTEYGVTFASTRFACSEIMRGIAERSPIILTPREHIRTAYRMEACHPYYFNLEGQELLRASAKAQRDNVERTGNAYGIPVD